MRTIKSLRKFLIKRSQKLDINPPPEILPYRPGAQIRHAQKKRHERKINAWKEANGNCVYCLRSFNGLSVIFHLDHIIPRSKGGTFDPENLIASCESCNCRRGNKDFIEYATKSLE